MAIEILKYGNKIQFSSDSYKPDVEYVDGRPCGVTADSSCRQPSLKSDD